MFSVFIHLVFLFVCARVWFPLFCPVCIRVCAFD